MISMQVADNLLGRTGKRSCVNCNSNNLLLSLIISQKGIPPGLPGHEISYSHYIIVHCTDCGCSCLEKVTHDCFDYEEVWEEQYEWFVINGSDSEKLQESLEKCPDQVSAKCYCDIHRSLRSSLFSFPIDTWNWLPDNKPNVYAAEILFQDNLPGIKAIIQKKKV